MGDTKERILLTALRLFADSGYEAVSVSDIASEIGITKGALYKHYKNKRDIFDSILIRMEQQDGAYAEAYCLPTGTVAEMENAYSMASIDRIVGFGKAMFRYWTQDEFASKFRKMLMLEQFRNEEMGNLYQQYLVSGPLGYLKDLFESIKLPGALESAAGFYARMFFMYSVYDGAQDKASVLLLLDDMLEKAGIQLEKGLL